MLLATLVCIRFTNKVFSYKKTIEIFDKYLSIYVIVIH